MPFVLYAILLVTTFGDRRILYEWVFISPDRILWCTDDLFPRALQGTLGGGDRILAIESFDIIFLPAADRLFWVEFMTLEPDLPNIDPALPIVL